MSFLGREDLHLLAEHGVVHVKRDGAIAENFAAVEDQVVMNSLRGPDTNFNAFVRRDKIEARLGPRHLREAKTRQQSREGLAKEMVHGVFSLDLNWNSLQLSDGFRRRGYELKLDLLLTEHGMRGGERDGAWLFLGANPDGARAANHGERIVAN